MICHAMSYVTGVGVGNKACGVTCGINYVVKLVGVDVHGRPRQPQSRPKAGREVKSSRLTCRGPRRGAWVLTLTVFLSVGCQRLVADVYGRLRTVRCTVCIWHLSTSDVLWRWWCRIAAGWAPGMPVQSSPALPTLSIRSCLVSAWVRSAQSVGQSIEPDPRRPSAGRRHGT